MKQIAYSAAVEALKNIFSDPRKDILTPQDIYLVVGRNLSQHEQNKKWLQNRLTPLKYYGLVESIYKGPNKMVDSVRLTLEGKEALASQATASKVNAPEVKLEAIVRDIGAFEKQNPSLQIQFVVTRREEKL